MTRRNAVLAGMLLVALVASVVFLTRQPGAASRVANTLTASFAPDSNGGCMASHPTFQYGFAALRQQLGGVMGEPLECEHSIHVNGDTRQRTTTGYAYYRTDANVPTFTDGWDHWALTQDGLVHWAGNVVDPPTSQIESAAGLQ